MLIQQLSDFSVKFTLSQVELNEYGLTFESIDSQNANTRVMVSHLILLAESQSNITVDFKHSQVYVEAFACSNGNYILYVSLIKRDTPNGGLTRSNFLLCTSTALDILVRLSKQLAKFALSDITSSTLFTQGSEYYLLLDFHKKAFEKILYPVAEFCEYSTQRPTTATIEQWHCLAEYDAVYRLSILEP